MKDFLAGYKTYIAAGIIAAAGFAVNVGWLTQEQAMMILAFANSLGLVGLHAQGERNTAKVEAKTDQQTDVLTGASPLLLKTEKDKPI